MIPFKLKSISGVILLLACLAASAFGGNIRATKHNLSISGTGTLTATAESRICIFCHISHQKNDVQIPYLWNRSNSTAVYTPYYSSTLKATVGQPTGSSRVCLSCHDGTIALGAVNSSVTEIPFKGGIRFMPPQSKANLTTNLSDDHPISFTYDANLSAKNTELRDPTTLPEKVKLEKTDQLQCISCHDPHDDTFGRFLVMDNTASALCMACHDIKAWSTSSHSRSTAMLDRTNGLWPNTTYETVAQNGCENCHIPHSAGTGQRLLIFAYEEDNCLACHDGKVAKSDIASAITKRYNHPVSQYTGVHDASEDFGSGAVTKHVECSDCHNAHQANTGPAAGQGMVSGANQGVSGISAGGIAVPAATYQFEICFKCHGDNNVTDTLPVTRQIDQLNTRLEFHPGNPSFHPVVVQGKNTDVPSLLPPYTNVSTITCTDCHASDDPAAAAGPHGSDYNYLLKDRYVTDDYTTETPSSYALCYTCHSRSVLFSDQSFAHRKHVVEQNTPCSACHDPHGVSYLQGTTVNNSHLINFDLSIVSPDNLGRLEYTSLGRFTGQCFLTCHGKQHSPNKYPE